jgi:hypothetical protein
MKERIQCDFLSFAQANLIPKVLGLDYVLSHCSQLKNQEVWMPLIPFFGWQKSKGLDTFKSLFLVDKVRSSLFL